LQLKVKGINTAYRPWGGFAATALLRRAASAA